MNQYLLFQTRIITFLLAIYTLLLVGCKSDGGLSQQDLVGKWKCVDGSLNGKPQGPQGMVTGFTFEFSETAFTSNILAELGMPPTVEGYQLKDNKIIFPSNNEVFFTVESFKEDTLILGLAANGMTFQFQLKK